MSTSGRRCFPSDVDISHGGTHGSTASPVNLGIRISACIEPKWESDETSQSLRRIE
jgi:hypothetical protein